MAWDVAENLKALRTSIKQWKPAVTIYTIGDDAHKLRSSDHNPDDTSGSKAEQTDSDSKAEVRALDVMLGTTFSKADALRLIAAIVGNVPARNRLRYIIFNRQIWSAKNGWKVAAFDGDPHTDHVHISNRAADDANAATWPSVNALSAPPEVAEMPLTTEDLLNVRIAAGNAFYDIFWSIAKKVDVKTSSGAIITDYAARGKPTGDNMLAVLVAPVLKAIADTDSANDKADAILDAANDAAAEARHAEEMAAIGAVPAQTAGELIHMDTEDLVDVLREGVEDWEAFKAAVAAA